ncbi:PIR protein [Plasmodium sp. DRC-Itaito]|nr:PIR protein [Plasmodium sp. DRC-Itaito]
MKQHYSKILLFLFPLNILLTLYQIYNTNKPYITPHHTQTNRSLCECDIQSSNYDKDTGMKSVMQQFVDRTSQRFQEYKERLKEKRQKRKEERDQNIQKIIEKDQREKSLAEKIERGCLRCGCGLGGVAASVGVFGGLGIYGSKTAAISVAMVEGEAAAKAAGAAAGAKEGVQALIQGLQEMGVSTLHGKQLGHYITATTYNNSSLINGLIQTEYNATSCIPPLSGSVPVAREPFCTWLGKKSNVAAAANVKGGFASQTEVINKTVENIFLEAETSAEEAAKRATAQAIKSSTDAVESTYSICQNAIIASVVAMLIIVLVMIIIYLILRYRRKKKMKKKAEYTKLLNQ